MLYIEAKHATVAVGQVRRCIPIGGTAVIVAVDQGPAGFVSVESLPNPTFGSFLDLSLT
jgi:hypothetical protein